MVILSGILLILSFPPFPFAFFIYFAFVPLLLVIDETPPRTFEDKFWGFFKAALVLIWRFISLQFIWKFRQKPWIYRWHIISHNAEVFRYAYTAFVIWNFGCCYWLLFTGLDADKFSEPFVYFAAGFVANLVNPFLMTIPVYLYTQVRDATGGWLSGLGLICFWVVFEWLHLYWDLAWPWLTLGHSLSTYPVLIQYAEFTGVLGVSAHILLVNVLIYYSIRAMRYARWVGWSFGAMTGIAIAIPFILNFYILKPERDVFQASGSSRVRMIQPNINSYLRIQTGTLESQVEGFIQQITEKPLDSIDLVILPEKALFKPMFANCLHLKDGSQALWEFVQTDSIDLITGAEELRYFAPDSNVIPITAQPYNATRQVQDPCYPAPEGYIARYNSAFLLSPIFKPQSIQKKRLVPMTEQIPFLRYFSRKTSGSYLPSWLTDDFTAADSLQLMLLKDSVSIAPVICYESMFGREIGKLMSKGAAFVTIITDDGFWKLPASQIQHAHFSRLRAIETRREVVRVANTGISMHVDILGNIITRTKRNEKVVIDENVKHYNTETYYSIHGDYIARFAVIIGLVIIFITLLIQIWRNARESKRTQGSTTA